MEQEITKLQKLSRYRILGRQITKGREKTDVVKIKRGRDFQRRKIRQEEDERDNVRMRTETKEEEMTKGSKTKTAKINADAFWSADD